MKSTCALILVALLASVGVAQEIVVDASKAAAGTTAYLKVVKNDDGEVTVTEMSAIYELGTGTPTPPDSGFVAKVRDAVDGVDDPQGRATLALIYSTISQQVREGVLQGRSAADVKKALDAAKKMALSAEQMEQWEDALSKVGELMRADPRGAADASSSEIASLLDDVGQGFAGNLQGADLDWAQILQMLIQLLQLLQELFA